MRSKKSGGARFLRLLVSVSLSLLLALILAFAVLWGVTLRAVDGDMDEALFADAGQDTVTRLYYHGADGEPVEGLSGYRAVEWREETLSAATVCLHTPLSEMPAYLPSAFIAIEDHRFYTHHGVDIRRTAMAALNTVFRFSSRFGGSTITQQLVKNIGGEKDISIKRKWREMVRAWRLESRHEKDEILEAYLNIVPLSGGCIGVGAAARHFFNKAPSELTVAECAGLAAITCAPSALDPCKHPDAYLARRDLVLGQMLRYGMIDEPTYREALAEELCLRVTPVGGHGVHSWYTETVLCDVKDALLAEGYTEAAAPALLYGGGLRIYTCADPRVQSVLERAFSQETAARGCQAAMTVLDAHTGDLLGIVGAVGKKQGDLVRNHARDTLRPPASALKPIALYAPAVERGLITEATVFDDIPRTVKDGAPWPKNASFGYTGLTNALCALRDSRNTVAVELYEMLGAEKIYGVLTRELGISTLCRREEQGDRVLTDLAPAPLALGQLSRGVSLLELTAAYLPLADGGRMHACRSFLLVTRADGTPVLRREAEERQVLSTATAAVLTHMLSAVVKDGSAAALTVDETVALAGKTGTSSGARDRWFIGYTPHLLAGIWCGTEKGSVAVGTQLALYDRAMREICAVRNEQAARFAIPTGLKRVCVCRDSGLLPCDACALDPRGDRAIELLLPVGEIPTARCDRHTFALRDEMEGGVVPPELAPLWQGDERLSPISLLRLPERNLPKGVTVADAAYGCYPLLGAGPCEESGRPYYGARLSPDVNIGLGEGEPYNRLSPICYHTVEEKQQEREQRDTNRERREQRRDAARKKRRLLRHFYHN